MTFKRNLVLPILLLAGASLSLQAAATQATLPTTATPAPAGSTEPSLAMLQEQAATGDAKAETALGERLMRSKSSTDQSKAVEWYRKAAAQGNRDAEWKLGFAYIFGKGVPRDFATGAALLHKSLPGAPPDHMLIYGMVYTTFGESPAKGLPWIKRSAEAGSTKGMVFWAILERKGDPKLGVPKNLPDSKHWMLKAARLGDVDAETMVGQMSIYGESPFARDAATGMKWLTKAANQGYSRAQGLLGALLVTGESGVPKHPVQGVAWAQKAAANRDVYGYYAMGLAYQHGIGGERVDDAKAWYDFAAAQRVDVKHELTDVAVHLSQVGAKLSAKQMDALQAQVSKIPRPKPNHQT